MGSILSRGVTANVSVNVHASPETVWLTIADLESIPSYFSFVRSVTIINEKNHHSENYQYGKSVDGKDIILMSEGLAWDEIRVYDGHEAQLHKRVTSIKTIVETVDNVKHQKKSVRIYVSFLAPNRRFHDVCNTSTLTIDSVVPNDNTNHNDTSGNNSIPDHCRLTGTLAFLPAGWWYQISLLLCAHC